MSFDSTVYIVDQSPDDCACVKDIVEGMGLGFEIHSSVTDLLLADSSLPRPGCIVFDYAGQGVDGIGLPSQLLSLSNPPIPSILVTKELPLSMAMRFVDQGVVAAFEKPYREFDLRVAITNAIKLDRKRYRVAMRLTELADCEHKLSPREQTVLKLMADGLTNRDIALQLDLATRTIESCRKRMIEKFGAQNASHLVCMHTEYLTLLRCIEMTLENGK